MAPLSLGPGDDVDAWCGKCLMVMNHRIIAVVGSQIKKVECLTCHAIHAYKSEPGVKATRAISEHPVAGRGKSSGGRIPRPSRAENEWNVFMAEMPPETQPRSYTISKSYSVAEFIEHPSFGVGRVMEITGVEKMVVIFKEGRKTLLCNRAARTI
jgi:hypothetical protein